MGCRDHCWGCVYNRIIEGPGRRADCHRDIGGYLVGSNRGFHRRLVPTFPTEHWRDERGTEGTILGFTGPCLQTLSGFGPKP